MKKSYQTRILLLLTAISACIYGLVYFVRGDGDNRLFPVGEQEGIVRISLENSNGRFEFYQDDKGQWLVKQGKEYLAEETKISLMLKALSNFEIERKLDAEIPEYHLEHPAAAVSFETEKGKTYSFDVGGETMTRNHVYVKDKSTDEIYITQLANAAQFGGSISAYRNRDVFQMKMEDVVSLTWKEQGQEDLVLQKEQETWYMKAPYQAPAREIELEELLASMKDWNVRAFADTEIFSEARMGLTGGRMLVLEDRNGTVQELEIGRPMSGTVPVRSGGKDNILLLYADEVDLSVLDADRLLFFAPLKEEIDKLEAIRINLPETAYEIKIDSANEVYLCNGQPVAPDLFYSFFVSYIGLNASGGGSGTTGETAAEFESIYKDGKTVTLTLKERDKETCSMFVDNNESGFYMSNEKLITLMEKINRMSCY